jgi:hypothetical protein
VACIGCDPDPPPTGTAARVKDETYYSYTFFGGRVIYGAGEAAQSDIGRKAYGAVGSACRGELRVTRLGASSFGIYALVFAFYKVHVELEAIPVEAPDGTCETRAAPGPGQWQ